MRRSPHQAHYIHSISFQTRMKIEIQLSIKTVVKLSWVKESEMFKCMDCDYMNILLRMRDRGYSGWFHTYLHSGIAAARALTPLMSDIHFLS